MGRVKSFLIKNIVLPVADKFMRTSISSSYHQLKNMRNFSKEEIQQWQNERLQQLVFHAFNHTKYYNQLFQQEGLLPGDIKSIADLKKLPVLTKNICRERLHDLLADNIQSISYIKSATGGSMGDPLIFYLDRRSWSMSNANDILNWEQFGYNYSDSFIALGSTSLYVNKGLSLKHKIYYKIKNKIGLNGINMSDEICRDYTELIRKKRIRFIYGYASSIYLLAKYVLLNNETLRIQVCFSTAEVLTDLFRKTIKEAFNCKIIDCYGAHDGGISAFAGEQDFFKVGYNCLVRMENINQDECSSALVTDLFNYAMPFINYELGDEILIDESKNKHYQYNGQIINKIIGRSSDIIQLENGGILTGAGFTVLFKDLPVEHYCIRKNGLNSIECSIVKLPGFDQSHDSLIRETFNKHIGDKTRFTIEYVNTIPMTKSGKRRYFIR